MSRSKSGDSHTITDEPRWYQDAVIYELHVRGFCDSDGDGIGDFAGLASKLDYLQDLGVTALWLLPFYPSPLKDDGYDIADYQDVHPAYGTLRDFKTFLKAAHERGLRVITELVLNHTSAQHPWFERARRSPPHSPWRDFYVWRDSPDGYRDARIIFKDFETSNWAWDPVAKAYYWHRFYSHQPDLNFDNPRVQRAILQAVDFWLGMGVDGLRLDAVPYLFEREGTSCENLPETHAFLRKLRRHVDSKYKNRMLLAEANQWPEDAVAYMGSGDECHMAFHFPVMPRMFMSLQLEDRFPIVDIMTETPAIPSTAQWALFLRNHDELTLEMVTDEDRDTMYRFYAVEPQARINLGIRRRLAPLVANRRKLELLNGLLFALPGTPVVYYADEIGMGDNIYLGDRNGVRTPMQWSNERNAGFSQANPQRLYLPVVIDPEYHYEARNVEAQQGNLHSVLWWMKRLIALRKQFRAFGRGTIEFLQPDNGKVLAFLRIHGNERLLVVANLSRFAQPVELNLAEYRGLVPVELFGRTEFPPIDERPYLLTLGPHSFYWFSLEQTRDTALTSVAASEPQSIEVPSPWTHALTGKPREALEALLPAYLQARRWFGGKGRRIRGAHIRDQIPIPYGTSKAVLAFIQVEYQHEPPETYLLPLAFASGSKAADLQRTSPHAIVAGLHVNGGPRKSAGKGVLFDALSDREFTLALVRAMERRRSFPAPGGVLEAMATAKLREERLPEAELEPRMSGVEQSNTSVLFGNHFILKLFRRVLEGMNPELELNRLLHDCKFPNVPALAGAIEYRQRHREPVTVGILQAFVPNAGDAWRLTLDMLSRYFERVLARGDRAQELPRPRPGLADVWERELPPLACDAIGPYLATAELLGRRTAEMHVALSRPNERPELAPEPFTALYQQSLHQTFRTHAVQGLGLLQRQMRSLPEALRPRAAATVKLKEEIDKRLHPLLDHRISGLRIRCHGDYHLGQVLSTGNDFVIIDFEGEPARSIGTRRIKRSPLADVAGMLRSFHYAAASALTAGSLRAEDTTALEPWSRFWYEWVSTVFLRSYVEHAQGAGFLPEDKGDVAVLLGVHLVEKAIYELQYELNNRPAWVHIPIAGLLQMLQRMD